MTPTSDERREVAKRLRRLHLGGANKDLIELTLSDAVGAWHENGMSWDYITERLADLIDPTCHIAPDDWASEQCMGPMLSCDRCCAWLPPINGDYHYCPNCGARVTSGGER